MTTPEKCAVLDAKGDVVMSWPARHDGGSIMCFSADAPRTDSKNIVGGAISIGAALIITFILLVIRRDRSACKPPTTKG